MLSCDYRVPWHFYLPVLCFFGRPCSWVTKTPSTRFETAWYGRCPPGRFSWCRTAVNPGLCVYEWSSTAVTRTVSYGCYRMTSNSHECVRMHACSCIPYWGSVFQNHLCFFKRRVILVWLLLLLLLALLLLLLLIMTLITEQETMEQTYCKTFQCISCPTLLNK